MNFQEALARLVTEQHVAITRKFWATYQYVNHKSITQGGVIIVFDETDDLQTPISQVNKMDMAAVDWEVYIYKAFRVSRESIPIINKDNSGLAINYIMQEAHATALEKGFWDVENNERQLAYMISELSEALEEMHKKGCDWTTIYYNGEKPEGLTIEFADCIIRICDFAQRHSLPLDKALKAKMDYNKTRSYQHGRKL